jgi:hypothetical protein
MPTFVRSSAFASFALASLAMVSACASNPTVANPFDAGADLGASDGGSVDDGVDAGSDALGADTHVATDTGPVDAGSPTATCASLATALCTRISACSSFGLKAIYGDVATCESRQAAQCLATLGAPDTGATIASTLACVAALPGIACAALDSGALGGACATRAGTVAVGGACGDDAQCASTFCARASTSTCGHCALATTVGGACTDGACSAGQACLASGLCELPVPGKPGDSCTDQSECDLANGVGCNTSSGSCLALTIATGSCGANSIVASSYAVCPGSGTCSAAIGGTCSPAAADGASCGSSSSCMPPARCVSGTCRLPAPSTCH